MLSLAERITGNRDDAAGVLELADGGGGKPGPQGNGVQLFRQHFRDGGPEGRYLDHGKPRLKRSSGGGRRSPLRPAVNLEKTALPGRCFETVPDVRAEWAQ